MKTDDDAHDPGAEQSDRRLTTLVAGREANAADAPRKPSSRVAARQNRSPADPAAVEVPAWPEPAPLALLVAPLESVEPQPEQRDEQGPEIIIGRHGKPVKKRDLRDRRGRKRPPYIPTGNPMGPQEFVPSEKDRRIVKTMVGMFVPRKVIAQMIGEHGIADKTLNKHFAAELEHGVEHVKASLKAMILQSAQDGSVRAQTYLLDRLGGPEFAPPRRDEVAVPLQISSEASSVQIYLPDNGRKAND